MKEACILILALLLGFFTSQSFSYDLQPHDMLLIERVQAKIDSISTASPADLVPLQTRLRISLRSVDSNSRAYVVLAQIAKYMANKPLPSTPGGDLGNVAGSATAGDGIIRAQAALFAQ